MDIQNELGTTGQKIIDWVFLKIQKTNKEGISYIIFYISPYN